jgi:RNA polymerase sigma factor (sigma-70 family)
MQVWNRARAGDLQAVTRILEMLEPKVERIGAHYARRTGLEREELVQEGLIAVLEGLAAMELPTDDPVAYLARLARWRMLDWVRWSRRRAGEPLAQEPAVLDPILAHADERIDVAEFVTRLTPRQGQITCGLMDGWNWREVARQMGCSSANLGYHVRQIRVRYQQHR